MLSRRAFVELLCAAGLVGGGVAVVRRADPDPRPAGSEDPEPRFTVTDFGARGDGRTNDTAAFQRASAALQAAGGGTLVIPAGTYVVGAQRLAGRAGLGYALRAESILALRGCPRPVLIEGRGATLRAADGLRFGAFHPVTGAPHPTESPFVDYDHRADAYWGMISLQDNADVAVRGVELDGNADGLRLGGPWGDTGRQCAATGIHAYGNARLRVEDVHTHHHGLDGVMIGYPGLRAGDAPRPHTLLRVRSEYNARQGLSWVGGIGLAATDCRFSHTGRGRFASAPGAGVDIEAEESVCRDGRFVRCEFVDNTGPGMVADVGDGGFSRFDECVFWGTTFWSAWPRKPGLQFAGCRFHGSIPNPFGSPDAALATRFTRCRFEDVAHPQRGVFRSTALVEADGDNLLFDGCTFVAHRSKALYLDGVATREIVRGCTVVHRFGGLVDGDFQSLVRGARLEDVRFVDQMPTGPASGWYVAAEAVTVGRGVEVTGPHTRWGAPAGRVGRITG